MIIRPVETKDAAQWLTMRYALWPEEAETHEPEIRAYFAAPTEPLMVFVAEAEDGHIIGFLETNIRNYAEGCTSHNVGYIEGWYVEENYRQRGVGRALVIAGENWARAQGCSEMASDCLIDNHVSYKAHLALKYEEVERIICFRKSL